MILRLDGYTHSALPITEVTGAFTDLTKLLQLPTAILRPCFSVAATTPNLRQEITLSGQLALYSDRSTDTWYSIHYFVAELFFYETMKQRSSQSVLSKSSYLPYIREMYTKEYMCSMNMIPTDVPLEFCSVIRFLLLKERWSHPWSFILEIGA